MKKKKLKEKTKPKKTKTHGKAVQLGNINKLSPEQEHALDQLYSSITNPGNPKRIMGGPFVG